MRTTTRTLPLFLSLGLAATRAAADLTPINDNRMFSLNVAVEGETGGDQAQDEYSASGSVINEFDPWDWSQSLSVGSGFSGSGLASGTMHSTISSTAITGDAQVQSSATILDETVSYAEGYVRALVQVGFTIESDSTWRLVAQLDAAGAGWSSVALEQGLSGASPVVFEFTTGSIDQSFSLAAGDYTLTMSAISAAVLFGAETTNTGSSGFDASFTLVPAPASGLALLLVPIVSRRRRA